MATGSAGGSDTQRSYYAKGTLDADRERRLQEAARLDMGRLLADQWEEGFSQLQQLRRTPRSMPASR